MRTVFKWYLNKLHTRPLPTVCLSSFFIHSVGDVLGQYLEQAVAVLDKQRIFFQASYGAFYAAPASHLWIRWINKRMPSRSFMTVFTKAAFSQLTYGPFIIASYLFLIAAANERSVTRGVVVMKERFVQTAMANFFVWTAFQTVNFWLVPAHFQVLYVSCVSVFWAAYMSYTRAVASKATRTR